MQCIYVYSWSFHVFNKSVIKNLCVQIISAMTVMDDSICYCPVPCRRVTYLPDLSYAHLSKHIVDTIWLGNPQRKQKVQQKYITAREVIYHSVLYIQHKRYRQTVYILLCVMSGADARRCQTMPWHRWAEICHRLASVGSGRIFRRLRENFPEFLVGSPFFVSQQRPW